MNYMKSFFCITILSLTFHSSANPSVIRVALRAGWHGFKQSLKDDLRPHIRKIEAQTNNNAFKYSTRLRFALKKEEELTAALKKERRNIKYLKIMGKMYEKASSVTGYFSVNWFKEQPKQLSSRSFLTDGKKTSSTYKL